MENLLLVTDEGLAYEQHKDSYKRNALLGGVFLAVGGALWFYSRRIKESQKWVERLIGGVKQTNGLIAQQLATISPAAGANLQGALASVQAPMFDDTIRDIKHEALSKLRIPFWMMTTGGLILIYTYFKSERYSPPENSYVELKVDKKGRLETDVKHFEEAAMI